MYRNYLFFATLTFLSGCSTYTPLSSGPIATLKLRSLSSVSDTNVEYCKTESCDTPLKIGLLAGQQFLNALRNSPKTLKKYENRRSHQIKIAANERSFIRFTTEKTIIQFDKASDIADKVIDYGQSRKKRNGMGEINLKCEAIIDVTPIENSMTEIIHTYNDKMESCRARIFIQ
ncbi:hypothetical protein J8L98_04950 [Pseudoalteromonas sp. MMG013]|uniref:hypothetical protein n=1 Tax=Pseudoalteromonas sp. MMG013 TaxID=2822687 RepID=UPI001B399768|nr:hypothetical protein [Pseudoalteromonas sp. MMG013]MBQ4861045.1 hypothetical protein [Pseudoalteromonas sp. MMG013]